MFRCHLKVEDCHYLKVEEMISLRQVVARGEWQEGNGELSYFFPRGNNLKGRGRGC